MSIITGEDINENNKKRKNFGEIKCDLIEVIDENGVPTNEAKIRILIHEDGDWHRVALACIVNEKNEILLQKRANTTKYPNLWDISVAAHIPYGETSLSAVKKAIIKEIGYNLRV